MTREIVWRLADGTDIKATWKPGETTIVMIENRGPSKQVRMTETETLNFARELTWLVKGGER